MQIIKITPRGFGANTYVLTEDGKNAIVIDPASPYVERELIRLGLTAKYVLLTHCHFDHVGGVSVLQQAGAKVLCHEQEKPLVGTYSDLFEHFGVPRTSHYYIDETFFEGKQQLCNMEFEVLHTPGHTSGSVCFLFTSKEGDKYLFTGDTLFCGTIGRTDFPTGSISILRESLKKLASLEGDYPIYAGHEEETTLSYERKTNPFLIDL